MKTIIIFLVVLGAVVSTDPKPKRWADQWEADFNEKIHVPIFGDDHVSGKWAYDWENKMFFVGRDNGKFDRYCGSIYKFSSTPCNQIVREGKRYIHFPEKKFCCMCCTEEKGCGIVKPDWFFSGVYEKEGKTDSGKAYNEFNVKGLQNNYYDEIKESQTPYRIFQDPLSDMVFKPDTYKEIISNKSIFDLPEDLECEQSCGFATICRLLS